MQRLFPRPNFFSEEKGYILHRMNVQCTRQVLELPLAATFQTLPNYERVWSNAMQKRPLPTNG
ncbi:hypothetical protein M595_1395 [Lyngbya aestuarii BL J]|uniref:Uncharacterized protein n=1 Tax=Lyngbya aestuarii BL J TaxID=1348334 RepID=U7QQC2_9CYAN|nr:hypothetical protein [Lyngbya aestuarii]ERT08616.1 hypothetical protein M595_1395 [Lyngbya aestuarii BL J]